MRDRPLLIATGNRHKFSEIVAFLDGVPWELKSLADYPAAETPDESGTTFEANAILKARYWCERLGVACVADDSGIEVDALGGAPGVYSARYAGEGCTDAENNAKLLRALEDVPEAKRTARFVCWCAYVDPEGGMHVERGTVEGRMAFEERGRHGFGYDPMFIPDGHRETFGELDPSVKAGISHRARAFGAMRTYLDAKA